jgi:hypothetical protein
MLRKSRLRLPAGMTGFFRRAWPAAFLLFFLGWGWRAQNILRSIPSYGDTLVFTWALSWYGDAIPAHQSISVYPLAFYPGGWPYAEDYFMLLALLPLYWVGGAAFAYNVATLLTFVIAFAGAYKLGRRFVGRGAAAVVAVLFTFWSLRWSQNIGHLSILIGSALLPWILWSLDRALRAAGRARLLWLVLTGVLWAVSMFGSMYFALIGGVAVFAWIAGCLSNRMISWRTALVAMILPGLLALLLSSPAILRGGGMARFSAADVNFWGASLNSLPLPPIEHPWFGSLARDVYRGLPFEQATTNLGPVALLLAVVGVWAAWRRPEWRPILFVAIAGLVLSLGLTLKWDNESLHWAALRPVSDFAWQIGHWLKPGFFSPERPPVPFASSIPMPGMLFAAIVPFAERARVFARYALAGSLGLFLLTALALTLIRVTWVRVALVLVLLVEVLPAPLTSLPFPPQPHPAFDWLKQQAMPGQSVVDVVAAHPYTPALFMEGQVVWATRAHGKPTVSGGSSQWPAYTGFLNQWLVSHEHAFWNLDLVPILRFYGIRYILLHVQGDWEKGLLEEAQQNQEVRLVQCFEGRPGPGPWPYPICVLEVLPPAHPDLNLILESGWSGQEDWGVWAEGTISQAFWVATKPGDQVLHVQAFPLCREDQLQEVSFEVNGESLAVHEWTNCEPWAHDVTVPAPLTRLGRNDLVVRSRYAARPVDVNAAQSDDTRSLSVGFTKLKVEPGP